MELIEIVWRIPETEVTGSGRWAGERFRAVEIIAVMEAGSGRVAWFLIGGRRMLRSRAGLAKWPGRFKSDDPQLSEYKLAARRIASAAQHKAAGDPAGRRPS